MSVLSRSLFILFICFFVLTPAQAKVRKCVLSNGHVIFTDVGCPDNARQTSKKQKSSDPFAAMSPAQRKRAIAKRDQRWENASKNACIKNIDDYAQSLQNNYSEMIDKKVKKLISRKHDDNITEYVHRVSFFFVADGKEWESSGNCHASLSNKKWEVAFKRMTTGIPFVSAKKEDEDAATAEQDKAANAAQNAKVKSKEVAKTGTGSK